MDLSSNAELADLRAPFEGNGPATIGIEEELMLLDPETLDLAPRAPEILGRLPVDGRFKRELPAAQLELAAPPALTVREAAAALREARELVVRRAGGDVRLAGAGAHPFAAVEGLLNDDERYLATAREYGRVARRQLVFGLHVHVAVAGADTALAVHDAVREYLPLLAALGAGAPFYAGQDTGLASVRPKLSELLPRQGVPPALGSWEALAGAFAWGRASGRFPSPGQWWWEARLHPVHGTVEVRVPDAQATITDVAGIAAVVHALVATLAGRAEGGELPPPADGWRIGENRWSACRYGTEGTWCDVRTGEPTPMRDRLHELLDELAPAARRLGCAPELDTARDLVERPRAALAREVAGDGLPALVGWLADRFLAV